MVDLDIEECYDSIPHEPLIDRLARHISDGKILELIRSFLKCGVMEEMNSSENMERSTVLRTHF